MTKYQKDNTRKSPFLKSNCDTRKVIIENVEKKLRDAEKSRTLEKWDPDQTKYQILKSLENSFHYEFLITL